MFEQSSSTFYPNLGDPYFTDQKHSFSFDFSSFHTAAEIAAPSVDSFESELDLLAREVEFNYQLTQVDNAFASNTIAARGPGSAITATTTESSFYDTYSTYSESLCNFSPPASTYSFQNDMEMEFQCVRVDDFPAATSPNLAVLDGSVDPTSFGALPPTPPHSPPMQGNSPKNYLARSSYSDYGPPKRNSISQDLFSISTLGLNSAPIGQSTISPSHISGLASNTLVGESGKPDARKKYKCDLCPKAFARAFNLKTHRSTHDPNRPKPFVCPHRSCGRCFSRKHDLGRHRTSIHHDDDAMTNPIALKPAIGIGKGIRSWCDSCGKSFFGKNSGCECSDVK